MITGLSKLACYTSLWSWFGYNGLPEMLSFSRIKTCPMLLIASTETIWKEFQQFVSMKEGKLAVDPKTDRWNPLVHGTLKLNVDVAFSQQHKYGWPRTYCTGLEWVSFGMPICQSSFIGFSFTPRGYCNIGSFEGVQSG